MLDHDETMQMIKLAKDGDELAKEKLVTENTPLIKSVIKRFRNFQLEYDDLFQLGCVGFVKAINNFDTSFNVKFSTYAVPMILGEVKRFMRDDGYIKISRAIKVLSFKIVKFQDDFKKANERDATIAEIAEHFNIDLSEVIFALDSCRMPMSIFEKSDESDERASSLIEKLPNKESSIDVDEKLILKGAIDLLDERERKIILLRYYRDKTQGEIAKYFGLSQVQISRLESKILDKLKKQF